MGPHAIRRDLRPRAPGANIAADTDGPRNATGRVAVAVRLLRSRGQRALKKVLIPSGLLLIATAGWFYGRKPDIPSVPFAKVTRETLVSMLPTNGKVEPFAWETARADVAGSIDRLSIQHGQTVAKGAALATLRLADL